MHSVYNITSPPNILISKGFDCCASSPALSDSCTHVSFVIFAFRCLSANSDDLFGDEKTEDFSSNMLESPNDALNLISTETYEPFLLAASPNDYLDAATEDSFSNDGGISDPGVPAALPLLVSQNAPEIPPCFHDGNPESHGVPDCPFPKSAACCLRGYFCDCIWHLSTDPHCDELDDYFCCETVTAAGQGGNCEEMLGWPGWFDAIVDF